MRFKKTLSIILISFILFSASVYSSLAKESYSVVNVTEIQKYCAGMLEFSSEKLSEYDFNSDGKITVTDATCLQLIIVGRTDSTSDEPATGPEDSTPDEPATGNTDNPKDAGLLNIPQYSAEKNGVSIKVENNEFSLKGTADAYTEFYINFTEPFFVNDSNKYTLSLYDISGEGCCVFYVCHKKTSDETYDKNLISMSTANAKSGRNASFSPTDENSADYCKIAIGKDWNAECTFTAKLTAEQVSQNEDENMNYLYVSKEYTTADEDYGITKFNTIYDANESISDSNADNPYTILVKPGIYTDLQERYAGNSDKGFSEFRGINTKDYVYYEADGDGVVIKWDGATGFDTLKREDIVLKCPFHIRKNTHTHIKGFTFDTKNLRYGIHVETGGKGYLSDWVIDNCTFIWGGNPDCTDYAQNTNAPVFGCGHSIGEKGVISNCKIVATNCTIGYQNHENKDYSGIKLEVKNGADITIKNCDFGGTKIQCRTLYGKVSDTPGQVTVDNCINISSIENLYSGESTEPWWIITQK